MDPKEFLIDEVHNLPFVQFGPLHITILVFTITMLVFVYIYRDKIRSLDKKTAENILTVGASIMLINMAIRYIFIFYYDKFDFNDNVPIHLCYLSGFLFMYTILFRKYHLLKYTFFLSFIGPTPAVIWPGLESSYNSFIFYNYTISHHFFMICSLFSFFALRVSITYKDVINLFIYTNFVFLAAIGFNTVFNTNYMFSSEIPAKVRDTLPFLNYFHPIFITEVMGIIIIHLLYWMTRKTNKELFVYLQENSETDGNSEKQD